MTTTIPATTTVDALSSLSAAADVHLPVALLALDPISHGAGNAGNTQLLRTQSHIHTGRRVEVPYVSGNSIRHRLRDALAWHLVRTLDVAEMSLARRVVDLLWSGGALTSTGNKADLSMIRQVAQILLGVSALGYSARSDIVAGTVHVANAHLVCAENTNRIPPVLVNHPHAALPAAVFRGKSFGTRHDVSGTPAGRYVRVESVGDLVSADQKDPDRPQQMIYDVQVIKPGTVLYTQIDMIAPTLGHIAALATALDIAAPMVAGRREITLGGKRSVGFGRAAVHTNLGMVFDPYGGVTTLRDVYEQHLRGHRDQVLVLLSELVG